MRLSYNPKRGWRWAYDLRFLDHGGLLAGCIAYVGPYASAREAFEEASWIGARA
jgi:hypothetical protein